MPKTMDQPWAYRGYHGCQSRCRLRVYERAGQPPVVIVTELADNPGTSVTNRIEQLATEVWKLLERPEAGIQVVEHYPDRAFFAGRPLYKEEFKFVFFTVTEAGYAKPVWQRVSKAEVEARIGQPLDDTPASG